MTEPNYARLFHEATGGCWHEWITGITPEIYLTVCKYCGEIYTDYNGNPTYDNPRDIILRMKSFCGEDEEKLKRFITSIGKVTQLNKYDWSSYIELKYILNPPALLKLAYEFVTMKGEERK